LPEFAHARSLEDVVALLPGKARVIYNAIMAMKHGILDIKPKFMPIKDQVRNSGKAELMCGWCQSRVWTQCARPFVNAVMSLWPALTCCAC
jgi:hypothetical protein